LVGVGLLLAAKTSPESWFQRWSPTDPALFSHAFPASAWSAVLVASVLVAFGASYRPIGGLLGFGALPLPTLVLVAGSPAASFACFVGSMASAVILRSLSKRDPQAPRDRRGAQRMVLDATHSAIATLTAGTAWAIFAVNSPLLATAGSTLLWLVVCHGLARYQHRSRNTVEASWKGKPKLPLLDLLWDALGWSLAASLALAVQSIGLSTLLPIIIGYLVLTVVGAGRELDRSLHLRRIRDLQHVGSMAQRLVPRERASELASQCLAEVKRAVDFSYFELRFESSSGIEEFQSKAHSPLLEGAADVPEHPPMAPGIHTRRSWLLIERDLLSSPMNSPQTTKKSPDTLPEPPRRLGRLRLWIDPRHSSEDDEALINDVVPQIAALIDRSRLDREARVDALTGLTRRHVFERELSRRLQIAQDDGHSVALLLFDLDHFKQINDTYGHSAGDRVLESVSTVLLRASEPGGLACRWGGEELALLQWGGGHNALVFAEELRRFIADQAVETESGELSVTTSVGVVAFPDLLLRDPAELMKVADEALYAAKQRGRNRALLACGRGRFKSPSGELVGELASLDPEEIPQL